MSSSGISCCRGAVVLCLKSYRNPEHFIKTMIFFLEDTRVLQGRGWKGTSPAGVIVCFELHYMSCTDSLTAITHNDVWCVHACVCVFVCVYVRESPWFVFVSRAENVTFKSIPFSADLNTCCGINGRLFS